MRVTIAPAEHAAVLGLVCALSACSAIQMSDAATLPVPARSVAIIGIQGYGPVTSDAPTNGCTDAAKKSGMRVVTRDAAEASLYAQGLGALIDHGGEGDTARVLDVDLVIGGGIVAHREDDGTAVTDSMYIKVTSRSGETVRGAEWKGASTDPGEAASEVCDALLSGLGPARFPAP